MKKRLISMLTVVTLLCSLLCIVPASAKVDVTAFDMSALPTIAASKLTDAQTVIAADETWNNKIKFNVSESGAANYSSVTVNPGSLKLSSNYGWASNNSHQHIITAQIASVGADGTLYSDSANRGTYVYNMDMDVNFVESYVSGENVIELDNKMGNTMNNFFHLHLGGVMGNVRLADLKIYSDGFEYKFDRDNYNAANIKKVEYDVNGEPFTLQWKYHIRNSAANSRVSLYAVRGDEVTTIVEELDAVMPGETTDTTAALGGMWLAMRSPFKGSFVEVTDISLYKEDLEMDAADELASLPESSAGYNTWSDKKDTDGNIVTSAKSTYTIADLTAGLYKQIGKINFTSNGAATVSTAPGSFTVTSVYNDWGHSDSHFSAGALNLTTIDNWLGSGKAYVYEVNVTAKNLMVNGTYPSSMGSTVTNGTRRAFSVVYGGMVNRDLRIVADGFVDGNGHGKYAMDLSGEKDIKLLAYVTPGDTIAASKITVYASVEGGELVNLWTLNCQGSDTAQDLGSVSIGIRNPGYSSANGELAPEITVTGAKIYEAPVKDSAKTDLGMDAADELAMLPKATVHEVTDLSTWHSSSAALPYYYEQFKGLIDFSIEQRGSIKTAPGAVKLISGHSDWGDAASNPKHNSVTLNLANIENWGGPDSDPYVIETDFTINNLTADGKYPSLMDSAYNYSMFISFANGRLNETMRFYADGLKSIRTSDCKKYIDLSGEKNIKLYSVFTPDESVDTARVDMYASINGGELIYLLGKTLTADTNYETAGLGTVKLGLVTAVYDSATEQAPYMEVTGAKMYKAPLEDKFTLNSLSYEKGENTLSVTGNFTKWRINESFTPNYMIVGLYDGNKLLAVNSAGTHAFGYEYPATVTLDTTGIDVTGKEIRVFVWDGLAGMNPYIWGDNTSVTIE